MAYKVLIIRKKKFKVASSEELTKRFRQLVQKLQREAEDKGLNLTFYEIGQKLNGTHETAISQYYSGKRKVGKTLIEDVKQVYNIDLNKPLEKPDNNLPDVFRDDDGVPIFDYRVSASTGVRVFNEEQPPVPIGYFKHPRFNDCDISRIVIGESMQPTLKNGDEVFGKRVYNLDSARWGELHIIITDEHDYVKRLQFCDDTDYVWACSDNPEMQKRTSVKRKIYEPIRIHKKDIRSVHIVRAVLKSTT